MKMLCTKSVSTVMLLFLTFLTFAQSGIYVGGHFRRDRTVTVPTLKASGFTYVILFNVKVEANGDLTTDGETICRDGVYVFGNTQPHYVEDVLALRQGMTSVRRVETCVGGWGSPSYDNIKALVNAQGTGPESILYRNFKALKDTIPVLEAVNNDDEHTYDLASATAFHVMLYDIGYKTTLAPYTYKSFWQSLATNVNNLRPGAVDRIDLQCYEGGASNNPKDWNINNIKLHAGLLHFNSTATITTKMQGWKDSSTTTGGFLWVYNANDFNLKNYATAITTVFGGGDVANVDKLKGHVTLYAEKNFQGKAVTFEVGKYTKAAIDAQEFSSLSLNSVKLSPGIKIELFKLGNCFGESFLLTENTSDVKAMYNADINSWIVRTAGDTQFSGKRMFIRNRKSGLYLTIASDSYDVGIPVVQKAYTGAESQKWLFAHLGDGNYRLINRYSVKSLQLSNGGEEDHTAFVQDNYETKLHQRFMVTQSETTGYCKLIPLHSMKYVAVEEETVNSAIVQSTTSDALETDWELIDEAVAALDNTTKNMVEIYPNPAKDFISLSTEANSISKIEITDLQGRIQMKEMPGSNNINVISLNPGIYFIKIWMNDELMPVVSKFIKM